MTNMQQKINDLYFKNDCCGISRTLEECLLNLEKVDNFIDAMQGNPFWGADMPENLGINNANLAIYHKLGVIKPTGVKKDVMINLYDDVYKKVVAQQWEIVSNPRESRYYQKLIYQVKDFMLALEARINYSQNVLDFLKQNTNS